MNLDHLKFAGQQLGMIRAAKANNHTDYRTHLAAAAALRTKIGPVYAPYPHPNRALVKALYTSLREHLITRAEFAYCLQNVMERHR